MIKSLSPYSALLRTVKTALNLEGEYKIQNTLQVATSECVHSSVTGSLSEVILWKDTMIHNMWREGPPMSLDERRVTHTLSHPHPFPPSSPHPLTPHLEG